MKSTGRPVAFFPRGYSQRRFPPEAEQRRCSMSISLRDQLRLARKEGLLPASRSKPQPKPQPRPKRRHEGPPSTAGATGRSLLSEPSRARAERAAARHERPVREHLADRIPKRSQNPQHAAPVETAEPRRKPPEEPAKPVIRGIHEIAARRAEQATRGSSGLLKPFRGGERATLRDYAAPPVHIIYTPSGGKPDR